MSDTFEALHHRDLLHLVNPSGDVGLLTLWSPVRTAKRRLESISKELLHTSRSRIAVIANLYGDGMYAMFCNLLFNPQVRHLIAVGEDLGLPTCGEIDAFISRGLEEDELLGMRVMRIVGTSRVFVADASFDEQRLRQSLSFDYLGKLSSAGFEAKLIGRLRGLPQASAAEARSRVRVKTAITSGSEDLHWPSNPAAHQIVRRRPLDCWEELVVRTMRFGVPVDLRSGRRLELLNVKAVVTQPCEESAEALASRGFCLDDLRRYQERMFDPELPETGSYTYGNRLGAHFRLADGSAKTLSVVAKRLQADPEARDAFISLWDTSADLLPAGQDGGGRPCLVTLFFRKQGQTLSLTATYRAHNLLIAWMQNVYGLIAIQRDVAQGAHMQIGPITIVSHSLGIDPGNTGFASATRLAETWRRDDDWDRETGRYALREDPHGYFVVTLDEARQCILVEHRFDGVLIKRYEGRRADRLISEIAADMSVSLVSHAMWLGAELARKEAMLSDG